jgi:hypothetical protein
VLGGMIVGITFIAAYIIYFKFLHPELNTSEHWWWGISPEGIGTVGMLLNFAMPSWSAVAPRDHHAAWWKWWSASASRAAPARHTRSRSDRHSSLFCTRVSARPVAIRPGYPWPVKTFHHL